MCHTCASDDPQDPFMKYNTRLVRCIRCPTAYHAGDYCIAAGLLIFTFPIFLSKLLSKVLSTLDPNTKTMQPAVVTTFEYRRQTNTEHFGLHYSSGTIQKSDKMSSFRMVRAKWTTWDLLHHQYSDP